MSPLYTFNHLFYRFLLYHWISSQAIVHYHANAMQIHLTWPVQTHCDQVINPKWPFAYSKYMGQKEELKGRVSVNRQDVRHVCQTRGIRSTCHICKDFSCGAIADPLSPNSTKNFSSIYDTEGENRTWLDRNGPCHFQLQGVSWIQLAKNIPTVSDVPWAVGGKHRYDFGGENTTHVCMYLSGTFPCQSSFGDDYSSCSIRCWGHKKGWNGLKNNIVSSSNKGWHLLNSTPWMAPEPSVAWSYPKADENTRVNARNNPTFLPQGYTLTLAGSIHGESGFRDGTGHEARFFHPEGVAVDNNGYVYVADTGNHAIRMISPKGKVTTIAGTGRAGSKDGPGMFIAEFSSPSDVAVWRDWQFWSYPDKDDPDTLHCRNGNGTLVLFVADTGNHRIRKITGDIFVSQDGDLEWKNVVVSCHSGMCSDDKTPQPGFLDGPKHISRFDSPLGLAVSNDGFVFVADSNNHLIRMVDRTGFARSISGKMSASLGIDFHQPSNSHLEPCRSNGNVQVPDIAIEAEFSFPVDLALGYDEKQLFVVDHHRLQLIDLTGGTVTTIAGDIIEDTKDGIGTEASFSQPKSITTTADGRIYISDSSSCRIRRVSAAFDVAQKLSCEETLASVFAPQGCASYQAAMDRNNLLISPISGSIFYNYDYRNETQETYGSQYIGRTIKNCVGSPPSESTMYEGDRSVFNDENIVAREDPNNGSLIKVYCPEDCNYSYKNATVQGFQGSRFSLFFESSSICASAMYLSIINSNGGLVDVHLTQLDPMMNGTAFSYSFLTRQFLITTFDNYSGRYFRVARGGTGWLVETISGGSFALPSFGHSNGCGYVDTFPPQDALVGESE